MIQSSTYSSNSHSINVSPQLKSQLIHTILIKNQSLEKFNNQNNQFNSEVDSSEKINKSIINNNKREKLRIHAYTEIKL